jgi:predicted DNA-binding protein with PD1-like motif
MQYTEGKTGRVFLVRIDHGEDLIRTLRDFIITQGIKNGYIRFIGALESGQIVTGPEKAVLPPDPQFEAFSGGWEVIGIATITPDTDGPHLHLHASIGRGKNVLTGCLREKVTVYIVVEAVITEITGVGVVRQRDPVTGMNLPEMDHS